MHMGGCLLPRDIIACAVGTEYTVCRSGGITGKIITDLCDNRLLIMTGGVMREAVSQHTLSFGSGAELQGVREKFTGRYLSL